MARILLSGTGSASRPAKELSVKTRLVLVALGLAGLILIATSVHESAAPITVQQTVPVQPVAPSTVPAMPAIAALPTIAPPRETDEPAQTTPPRAGFTAASLPSLDPERTIPSL